MLLKSNHPYIAQELIAYAKAKSAEGRAKISLDKID